MQRPLATLLASLLALAAVLAVAGAADAAPSKPLCDLTKGTRATCDTALDAANLATGEANCLLYTAPAYWDPACTTFYIGPLPLVDYAFCYYNTAPSAWTTCV
ncbi:MAG: hypothetical protein QOI63_202 [Thermoplasmata archaeon]|jgi:hypothetical protein|nr:hypothetical protein [Thermoplasmata archaeon]